MATRRISWSVVYAKFLQSGLTSMQFYVAAQEQGPESELYGVSKQYFMKALKRIANNVANKQSDRCVPVHVHDLSGMVELKSCAALSRAAAPVPAPSVPVLSRKVKISLPNKATVFFECSDPAAFAIDLVKAMR